MHPRALLHRIDLIVLLLVCGCQKERSSGIAISAPPSASASPLASLAATAVEITPSPTLDEPTTEAGAAWTDASVDAASSPTEGSPRCATEKPSQLVHVWFETRIVPRDDAPNVKLFKGFVRIPELKIDKEVFAESAQNCKSCRAKIRDTSMSYHCGGDMAGADGEVSIRDGVLVLEGLRTPAPPSAKKDIERHALACGSKAIFRSTSPDPDKKPVTGCE